MTIMVFEFTLNGDVNGDVVSIRGDVDECDVDAYECEPSNMEAPEHLVGYVCINAFDAKHATPAPKAPRRNKAAEARAAKKAKLQKDWLDADFEAAFERANWADIEASSKATKKALAEAGKDWREYGDKVRAAKQRCERFEAEHQDACIAHHNMSTMPELKKCDLAYWGILYSTMRYSVYGDE